MFYRPRPESKIGDSQRGQYRDLAFQQLKRACELDPTTGLHWLGLASLYQQSRFPADWREEALGAYRKAYEASKSEVDRPRAILDPSDVVSYEAGRQYIELVDKPAPGSAEAELVAEMRDHAEKVRKFPVVITPILLSLTPTHEILSPRRVTFDLDGTGRNQPLTQWPQPGTAFLVWDPLHTGVIQSGRQLFGSVTWWLFWEDGYKALAALDDNADGEVAGKELQGLALWYDRNGNGISDPGEVVPIERTPIQALRTQGAAKCDTGLCNASGLRLADGSVLPTWDWVVVQ